MFGILHLTKNLIQTKRVLLENANRAVSVLDADSDFFNAWADSWIVCVLNMSCFCESTKKYQHDISIDTISAPESGIKIFSVAFLWVEL